jgi:predicted nucleotidyltransferase
LRLTEEQQVQIRDIVITRLGEEVAVSVYGSRTDDCKRGGDVDLLIDSPGPVPLMERASVKLELERALALPVDLLFVQSGTRQSAFQLLARAHAEPLPGAAR